MPVGIELAQFQYRRGPFESEDIINNAIGGAVGFLLYLLLLMIVKRGRSEIEPLPMKRKREE